VKGSAHAGGRRAFLPQGSDPLNQSRTYAMLHAAIHDALNAVHQTTHPLYHMMFDLQGCDRFPLSAN
jgi:metal-dependent HD superfamily phosphatase/phosphodiesterase